MNILKQKAQKMIERKMFQSPVERELYKRFKAKIALDGTTINAWLVRSIKDYLGE